MYPPQVRYLLSGVRGLGARQQSSDWGSELLRLSDADAQFRSSLLTADDVALSIIAGVEAGQFLILPHPVVQEYAIQRAKDHERWIKGMQSLRGKAVETLGRASPETLYKLV